MKKLQPPISLRPYDLTGARREKFIKLLNKPPTQPRDILRIGCIEWSDEACVAAGKFLILFSEAGWKIDDDKVFMRSIASRGALGGVSKSLRNVIRILDAAGYDLVLVESVGAGQVEVEISKIVNLTAVVFTPNTGDNIQAVKAGLTEIGDLYIINKADLDGAMALFNSVLDLIGETERKPVVLKVSAKTGKGTRELATAIDKLLRVRSSNYKEKERKMLEIELRDMVLNMIVQKAISMLNENDKYFLFIDELASKKIDPYQAAEKLAAVILK